MSPYLLRPLRTLAQARSDVLFYRNLRLLALARGVLLKTGLDKGQKKF